MTRRPDALRHAAEIGDRDARHVIDRLDAVELERLDDEVKAVGQFALGFGGRAFRFGFDCCISQYISHDASPYGALMLSRVTARIG